MKDLGTQAGYKVALTNFENFCKEKYGQTDCIDTLKESSNEEIYDFLQLWINWNSKLTPRTITNYFSRVKKYLHYRGIKLDIQDIKEELDFPRHIEEELYGLTIQDIHTITNTMNYKTKTQFVCQLSSCMRIGEIVQLRKRHLITGQKNIIVKIPSKIAKFKKGRTTFFSKEASKMLIPILKKMNDEDLVFGSHEKGRFSTVNSEQILKRILIKTGLDKKYESGNRYLINTHSFRAYGITKLSRHDPNFAKKISGQKGYLLQYDRMNDEEKLDLYEKYESVLIIDQTEKLKLENQHKQELIDEFELMREEIKTLRAFQRRTEDRLEAQPSSS
jgi:integrase